MNKLLNFWITPRALVIVAPVILLAPVWLAGKALYWGTPSTQFIPWWWQAFQTLRAGELPLWNPMLGMGAPLLANYQSALFYPPTWMYFLLASVGGLPLMAWGMAVIVAVHLAWAGWGMVKLTKSLGLSELAQTVAGLAFSLSGYLVARAHFLSINAAIAWLPWILLAAVELAEAEKKRRPMLKLALFFALQWLAGHAQISWYTLLLASAWMTFWAWRRGRGAELSRSAARFVAAGLFAFGLAAAQLIPTAEYFLQSQRAAELGRQAALTYSFWPWRLLTLFAPNLFGNPANGDYWGYGNFWEDAIYVGLLSVFLGFVVLLKKQNKDRPLVSFLASVAIVSLLLALGKNLAIFPWLFDHIPTFNLFQAPSRFSIWAVFAFALLASLGVEHWHRPQGRGLYWARLAVAGALAIILGAVIAAWATSRGLLNISSTFIGASISSGAVMLGIVLLNLTAPKQNRPANARWVWLVALLLSADLLYAGWGLNPGVSLDFYRQESGDHIGLRNQIGSGRLYIGQTDEQNLKFETLFRFDDFHYGNPSLIRATLIPNVSVLENITTANNFDPLLPRFYQEWVEQLTLADAGDRQQMLSQMNVTVVEYLVSNESPSVTFEPLPSLSRVRWVCTEKVGDIGKILSVITEPCAQNANVDVMGSFANRVDILVESTEEGWLLLADTWYPGWRALVDGEQSAIYLADGIFRAVQITAGRHEVEFLYQPKFFYTGLVLSFFAWSLFVYLWSRPKK